MNLIRGLVKVMLVGACLLLTAARGSAAVAEAPLAVWDGAQRLEMSEQALIEDGAIWLPTGVLQREIYQRTETHSSQLQLRFALPRVALGERAADKLVFSAVQLALPIRSIGGAAYVEADPAAKLLGFALRQTDGVIELEANRYGSFAPQVLEAAVDAPSLDGAKIQLAWQPTVEAEHNLALLDKHPGLNVVSPSWFAITDATGFLQNKADAAYVRRAHAKGYQVWALITNSFDPDLTRAVLHSERARRNVVRQLLIYTRLYGLDGINFDFENVYDSDRDALTDFVAGLSEALRGIGATVSMDVTIPSGISQWSTCYDRGALSKSLDYMILMAYDEHWRTSPVSGSVASLGWVEAGVVKTLAEVPAEKLVLGVPLYMREWRENASGAKEVSARTMTMEQAEETVARLKLTPVWLEEAGQYYFEYTEGGARYRVWQEEEQSLALKAELVGKYRLAGVAAWRKGFEKPEIWNVLHERLQTADAKPPDKKKIKKRN